MGLTMHSSVVPFAVEWITSSLNSWTDGLNAILNTDGCRLEVTMETTLIRVLPSGPNLDPETSRGFEKKCWFCKDTWSFFLNFILILIRVVKFRVNNLIHESRQNSTTWHIEVEGKIHNECVLRYHMCFSKMNLF